MEIVLYSLLIGLVGGLLGIFYRNCLKVEGMIFYWWYEILSRWVNNSEDYCDSNGFYIATKWDKFLGWIAYPLGYCIYCSTTWITIFLYLLFLCNYTSSWSMIVIGLIAALGVQHLVVVGACKWLIYKHPDLG